MSDLTTAPQAEPQPAKPHELFRLLADPFPAAAVCWLPRKNEPKNARVPCVAYLETATILERLNAVCTWQSRYTVIGEGAAVCELSIRVGADWVVRTDVGTAKPKGGDEGGGNRLKSAFSDALKRAAAKFGVGLYLTHLAPQWLDWDATTKRIVGVGQLPAWALPGGAGHPPLPPGNAAAATKIGHAIAAAFQAAADATSFSLARMAYLHASGTGRIGDSQRAVIRGSRKQAAERLKLNDEHGGEE